MEVGRGTNGGRRDSSMKSVLLFWGLKDSFTENTAHIIIISIIMDVFVI